MRNTYNEIRALQHVEDVVCVFGPIEGAFKFQYFNGNDYTRVGTPHDDGWRAARAAVKKAVELLTMATPDWDDRSPGEREFALEAVKKAGVKLFISLIQESERHDFLRIFNSINFLTVSTERDIPWEWMYIGQPDLPCDPMNFLGARLVISQSTNKSPTLISEAKSSRGWDRFNQPLNPDSSIGTQPGIHVRIAEDNRFKSAKLGLERAIFSSHGVNFSVLDPLSPGIPNDKRKFYSFFNNDQALSHFNCHGQSDEPSIYVTNRFELTINDLNDSGHVVPDGSTVMLNCCNSITISYDETSSIARTFKKQGAGIVIGTTASIDDTYAAQFALAFYARYLKGESAGESLLQARHEVIQKTSNPACLVYSLLGPFSHRLDAVVA